MLLQDYSEMSRKGETHTHICCAQIIAICFLQKRIRLAVAINKVAASWRMMGANENGVYRSKGNFNGTMMINN